MTDETTEVPAAPPEIPDGARLIARITGAADGPPWLLLRLGDGGLALQAHGGDGSVRALDLHARRALFRAICDEDGPDLIGGAVEQPREALRNVTAFLRTWRAAHPGADTIAVEDGPCPPLWASDVTTLVMALALGAGHLGGGLPDEDIAAFLDERLGLPGGRKVYADADDGEIILTAGEHGAARPALWVATAPDDWTGHLLDESDVQALLGGFARAYADIETRLGVAGWSLGFDLDRGDGSQVVITLRPDSGRLAPQIAASRAAGCRHLVPCLPGRCPGMDPLGEATEDRRGVVSDLPGHLAEIRAVATEQAADPGLWFGATTAPEAYLQQELRRLHLIIERDVSPGRAGSPTEGSPS